MINSRTKVGASLLAVVVAFLAWAAISKIIEPQEFKRSVLTWKLLPARFSEAVTVIVPAAELTVAGLWIGFGKRRAAWILALALIVVYSLAFTAHLMMDAAPTCQCAGLIDRFFSQRSTAEYVLARNGVLLVLLILGAWCVGDLGRLSFARLSLARLSLVKARAPDHTRSSGFTLIEMLVCISIVALLIAIVIPGLGMAREAARRTISLSNLRQHGSVFAMYNSDWADQFPYFLQPVGETTILCKTRPREETVPFYHWAHNEWNFALADRYYNGQWDSKAFFGPGYPAGYPDVTGPGGPTTYWYGCAFVCRPEFWNAHTRTGIDQRRPTRLAEVSFPSLKLLILSSYPLDLQLAPHSQARPGLSSECQFVDGSATRKLSEFVPGYHFGDGPYPGSVEVHQVEMYWGLHTIDGVRGRDVKSR